MDGKRIEMMLRQLQYSFHTAGIKKKYSFADRQIFSALLYYRDIQNGK